MPEIVYSKPVDVISFKIFGVFDVFRTNPKLNGLEDAVQIVLLLVSLYKDDVINEKSFTNDFSISDLKKLILESKINTETKETYFSIIDVLSDSLSQVFSQPLDYLSFHLFQIEKELLSENFSGIVDDIIYRFSQSQGRYTGEFIQPVELTRLMCGLAKLKIDSEVFNPCAGLASFGIYLNKVHKYFGQEINQKTWALGALRLMAYEKQVNSAYVCEDSILNWSNSSEKYDLIISNPPFGIRFDSQYKNIDSEFRTIEDFLIEKGVRSLKEDGKLIALLPQGFLFRGGQEQRLREFLTENDLIDTIISLPGGLLLNTGIPLTILVINKSKDSKGKVKFVNAINFVNNVDSKLKVLDDNKLINFIHSDVLDNSVLRIVDNEQIRDNDYNLSVARYFQKQYKGVLLGTFTKVLKGIRVSAAFDTKWIKIKDLKEDNLNFQLDIDLIENTDIIKRSSKCINKSCLLVSKINNILKPTYFEYSGKTICVSDDILALEITNTEIDIEFLVNEFYSEDVLNQAKAFFSGGVIARISERDLLAIKFNIPTLEEQKAKVEGIKQAFLENKRKELVYQQELLGLKDESFREFASIKHTFRQYLNALKSNVAGTKLFVLNNQETGVTLDSLYSKNLNKTFGEHLSGLEGTISSMSKLLLSFETSNENQLVEEYNLIQLVEEAQNRFKNTESFQFEKVYFDTESFTLDDDSILEPIISINEDDFYRIFSNIVSNALDHGFKDISKKYIIRTSISFDENEKLCILEVSNNGIAMPKDFTLKDLTTRGEKTTDSKGSGMGGADIKNILKKYDGILDITNQETEEFPVTYILKLPLFTLTL